MVMDSAGSRRPAGSTAYDAVILAGGRGVRVGGADKGALVVRGRRLLDTALDAAAGARRIVVVGAGPVPAGVLLAREEPPYAGPAAAVAAGLAALHAAAQGRRPVRAPLTLVLACDLPDAVAAVDLLLRDCDPTEPVEGWCLTEPPGRMHWLLGIYRTAALEACAAALGDPTDRAMGQLLSPLSLLGIPAPGRLTADVDTREDLDRWRGSAC